MPSSIEWTDETCSRYDLKHGTDKRGCAQGGRQADRRHGEGIPRAPGSGPQVVFGLLTMAAAGGVCDGSLAVGWTRAVMPRVQESHVPREVRSKAEGLGKRTLLRSGAGRRSEAGQAPCQLLRGGWSTSSSELSRVQGLWSCLGRRGATA